MNTLLSANLAPPQLVFLITQIFRCAQDDGMVDSKDDGTVDVKRADVLCFLLFED